MGGSTSTHLLLLEVDRLAGEGVADNSMSDFRSKPLRNSLPARGRTSQAKKTPLAAGLSVACLCVEECSCFCPVLTWYPTDVPASFQIHALLESALLASFPRATSPLLPVI